MHETVMIAEADRLETEAEDAAWASINTPLQEDELIAFCQTDIERLFRINPYLEFHEWSRQDDNHYRFTGRNFSQEEPFEFETSILVEKIRDGVQLHYSGGLKRSARFKVEPSPYGSKLTIHESYPPLTDEEKERLFGQVDRSLTTWAGDIQKYTIMWKRWRWFGPWRWYMGRIWQRMKPSGRRIAYMFWWITLVEIALIVLGVGIYFVEYS